eukprot:scaffold1102_cov256-Pinguiococcus_pyrenoidosus.AAC.31
MFLGVELLQRSVLVADKRHVPVVTIAGVCRFGNSDSIDRLKGLFHRNGEVVGGHIVMQIDRALGAKAHVERACQGSVPGRGDALVLEVVALHYDCGSCGSDACGIDQERGNVALVRRERHDVLIPVSATLLKDARGGVVGAEEVPGQLDLPDADVDHREHFRVDSDPVADGESCGGVSGRNDLVPSLQGAAGERCGVVDACGGDADATDSRGGVDQDACRPEEDVQDTTYGSGSARLDDLYLVDGTRSNPVGVRVPGLDEERVRVRGNSSGQAIRAWRVQVISSDVRSAQRSWRDDGLERAVTIRHLRSSHGRSRRRGVKNGRHQRTSAADGHARQVSIVEQMANAAARGWRKLDSVLFNSAAGPEIDDDVPNRSEALQLSLHSTRRRPSRNRARGLAHERERKRIGRRTQDLHHLLLRDEEFVHVGSTGCRHCGLDVRTGPIDGCGRRPRSTQACNVDGGRRHVPDEAGEGDAVGDVLRVVTSRNRHRTKAKRSEGVFDVTCRSVKTELVAGPKALVGDAEAAASCGEFREVQRDVLRLRGSLENDHNGVYPGYDWYVRDLVLPVLHRRNHARNDAIIHVGAARETYEDPEVVVTFQAIISPLVLDLDVERGLLTSDTKLEPLPERRRVGGIGRAGDHRDKERGAGDVRLVEKWLNGRDLDSCARACQRRDIYLDRVVHQRRVEGDAPSTSPRWVHAVRSTNADSCDGGDFLRSAIGNDPKIEGAGELVGGIDRCSDIYYLGGFLRLNRDQVVAPNAWRVLDEVATSLTRVSFVDLNGSQGGVAKVGVCQGERIHAEGCRRVDGVPLPADEHDVTSTKLVGRVEVHVADQRRPLRHFSGADQAKALGVDPEIHPRGDAEGRARRDIIDSPQQGPVGHAFQAH